jgi:hypothetical protein
LSKKTKKENANHKPTLVHGPINTKKPHKAQKKWKMINEEERRRESWKRSLRANKGFETTLSPSNPETYYLKTLTTTPNTRLYIPLTSIDP